MKSTNVFAAAALLAIATTVACEKKEPPKSETNTTSAPIDQDRPVETTNGTVTTGGVTDPGNTQGGGAALGTTESTNGATIRGGRDAGLVDWPAVPVDRDRAVRAPSQDPPATTPKHDSARTGEQNSSTPLGNGKSGQYTGGEGTYGGKATHGTGNPKP